MNLMHAQTFSSFNKINTARLFIIWSSYFLLVQTFGYFYNYGPLSLLFLPLVAITIVFAFGLFLKLSMDLLLNLDKYLTITYFIWLLTMAYILKISFIYPDYSYDGLAYHLPASVEWAKSSKISVVAVSTYSSSYPGLSELIQALWFKSTQIYGPPHNISQIVGLVLVGFASLGIARALSQSTTIHFFSLIFATTIPNVILQSTVAYNDLFFSGLFLLSIYFLINFTRDISKNRYLYLYSSVCAAGLMASVKFTGLYYFGIVVFSIFAIAIYKRSYIFWHIVLAPILGISLMFVWYFRNWSQYQNPFYPASVNLGPITLFDNQGFDIDEVFFNSAAKSKGISNNWSGVFKSWFKWPIDQPVYDTRIGGSGIAWQVLFFLGLILFIYFFVTRKTYLFKFFTKLEIYLLTVSMFSVFFIPAGWWPRYVLYFPVLTGLIIISKVNFNLKILQKLGSIILIITMCESLYYLGFLAGNSRQPIGKDLSFVVNQAKTFISTGYDLNRGSVYEHASPEMNSLSKLNPSTVYINSIEYQYFPLYGLDFQHKVIHAFTKDFDPKIHKLLDLPKVENTDQLFQIMEQDLSQSLLVTTDQKLSVDFKSINSSCIDLNPKNFKTIILMCR